jgi:hypothetical protein
VGQVVTADALDRDSSYHTKGYVGIAMTHGGVGEIEGNVHMGIASDSKSTPYAHNACKISM